jgi:hypothetical protein
VCLREQRELRERGGWIVAINNCRGRPRPYVDRIYASKADAAAALDDMLSIYPPKSEWRTKLRVVRYAPN